MKEELQILRELMKETAIKYGIEYITACVINDSGNMHIQIQTDDEIINIDDLKE